MAPTNNPGIVDGEDTGENMGLGYDDSNAPTDQGGDQITNGDDTIYGNDGFSTVYAIDGIYGNDGLSTFYKNDKVEQIYKIYKIS